MQLSIVFVASLIGAISSVSAIPMKPTGMQIPLSRRSENPFHVRGSDLLDMDKLSLHLRDLETKYEPASADSLSKRAGAKVSLTDQAGQQAWTAPMTFGSSQLSIQIDTGSADCIVNQGAYKPGSTSKATGQKFSISYLNGSDGSGTVYTDTVSIGGISDTGIAVGLASLDPSLHEEHVDGVCGMGYPALSRFGGKYPPFFDALVKDRKVSSNVFGMKLGKKGSSLYLGGTDQSLYKGPITYVPLADSRGYWSVGATISGQKITAVIDSGASLIMAPLDQALQLFKTLGLKTVKQDAYTLAPFDCKSPPNVVFNFAGHPVKLGPDTISLGVATDGSCVLPIVGTSLTVKSWIQGYPLMQNAYIAFDRSKNSVGFANLA